MSALLMSVMPRRPSLAVSHKTCCLLLSALSKRKASNKYTETCDWQQSHMRSEEACSVVEGEREGARTKAGKEKASYQQDCYDCRDQQ